jgi:hypothetical protein
LARRGTFFFGIARHADDHLHHLIETADRLVTSGCQIQIENGRVHAIAEIAATDAEPQSDNLQHSLRSKRFARCKGQAVQPRQWHDACSKLAMNFASITAEDIPWRF